MASVNSHLKAAKKQSAMIEKTIARLKKCRFDTIATSGIYSGDFAAAYAQGSIIEPSFLSSAQHFADSKQMEAALSYQMPAWAYSRIANPTIFYLEQTLSLLESYGMEENASCCVCASGMAAICSAIEPLLVPNKAGDPINFVSSSQVYGGTFMQFTTRQQEQGKKVRFVAPSENIETWAQQIDQHTRFVFIEVPSNPNLSVCDIKALAALAHKHHIPLLVDATVATPALLRPLSLGADIVIHSLSKSIGASGMAIGGALISRKNIIAHYLENSQREDFASYVKLWPNRDNGPCLAPLQASLILNDLRTLRMRMASLSHHTLTVAQFLAQHKKVESVYYPGLASHQGHELAREMFGLVDSSVKAYGHLLSFTVKGGKRAAMAVLDRLELIWRATDLGRIKSVATIPSISTHQQQGDEGRALSSIEDGLIRLSVGNEHPADIIADLSQALS